MSDENLVWKIAGGVLVGLIAWNVITTAVENYRQRQAMEIFAKEMQRIAADPDPLGWQAAAARQRAAQEAAIRAQQATVENTQPVQPVQPIPHEMTKAEIREWKRRSEESMKILEKTTPDM